MSPTRLLADKCPLLPRTAAVIGDVQIRNRGTLAGSLAHADPAADMPAAILALGGELNAVGPGGQRRIRAENFFQGMFSTALAPDEILTEILVPVAGSQRVAYLKAARRPSDFALVGVAVAMRVGRDRTCEAVSIGGAGVTDRPFRARAVEEMLRGRPLDDNLLEAAASGVTRDVDVTDSIQGSKAYRSALAKLYVVRATRAAT